MFRNLLVLFFALLPAIFLSCRHERPVRIGVSQCSNDSWRSKMNSEMEFEMTFHDGAEIEIRSADDCNEKQIEDIRYFRDNGFDIIIAAPNEAEAITPIIKEVYESGIPVIIFDRDITGPYYTAFQGVDNNGIGHIAGDYAAHLMRGEARIIEIEGRPGSTPARDRHDGFGEAISRYPEMRVVASAAANWNNDEASVVADSLLALHPETDLIYAHNDAMAIAAANVARRRGIDARVLGIDAAVSPGIRAVADSVIDATFLYSTEGGRIIRTAFRILDGQPFDTVTMLPALSAVDLSNADIILRQEESLRGETEKINSMRSLLDSYLERYSSQKALFYAAIVIVILLVGITFLLARAFWQHRAHRLMLERQNALLQEQRDVQRSLNQQLEQATHAKLVFYTNVSHDLRTPLSLIAEPVEQLSAASNLEPRQRTLMQIADKNVKILRRLIDQILDFRRYENGKQQLNLAEADLGALVRDWSEAFRVSARRHDIDLRVVVRGSESLTLAIDVEKIERVFFNLVSNAIKYTPANGTVTITVEPCDEGRQVRLTVADTGRGLAPDELQRIFDRFYQVEKVRPDGSGIGLSLVKAFVEHHGGTVTADSAQGRGSEFVVTLPVRHVSASVRTATAAASAATADDLATELSTIADDTEMPVEHSDNADGKPLILVIDDNDDMRLMLSGILADEYSVISAADARRGLRCATRYTPDLIICDVMMPGLDGLECTRRLKAEVSTSHIPVLLVTACALERQRADGYRSGADGYIAKPFSAEVLKARIASLLENRKRILNLWHENAANGRASDHVANPSPLPAPVPVSAEGGNDIDDEFYRRFIEKFNERIADADLNVDVLAASLGLGRSQFYRKIKSLTNYSPVELIRRLRLRRARTLLSTTDRTVSEIAYAVGFSTPAYFTKCYREAYGETPSEHRQRLTPES